MSRGVVLAALLVVVGSVVVALPDDDRRLFSISRGHGPSVVDTAGTALVLIGWGLAVAQISRRRRRVLDRLGALGVAVASASLVAGLALVLWSVLGDHGGWWILGVVMAATPQAVAAVAAWKSPAADSGTP